MVALTRGSTFVNIWRQEILKSLHENSHASILKGKNKKRKSRKIPARSNSGVVRYVRRRHDRWMWRPCHEIRLSKAVKKNNNNNNPVCV